MSDQWTLTHHDDGRRSVLCHDTGAEFTTQDGGLAVKYSGAPEKDTLLPWSLVDLLLVDRSGES